MKQKLWLMLCFTVICFYSESFVGRDPLSVYCASVPMGRDPLSVYCASVPMGRDPLSIYCASVPMGRDPLF